MYDKFGIMSFTEAKSEGPKSANIVWGRRPYLKPFQLRIALSFLFLVILVTT